MLGNDVVDLRDPDCGAGGHHPRFDRRVFRERELAALAENASLRWILWAAKESAFKAARRRDPEVVFSPRRFAVALDGPASGSVLHDRADFRLTFEQGDGFVHAVAEGTAAAGRRIVRGVARIPAAEAATPDGPGRAVRALAIDRLAPHLGIDAVDLSIHRHHRRPSLRLRGAPVDATLSLSHHGRFIAFACALPAGPPPSGAPSP